ncbi:hypothetical protein PUN28_007116 [Cardiocondyla obscurior]|uniref:Uncharacterized protein n=1 Tax=Cardiocondyla obscurior TaxID=286306 RepID=A0AAW2G1H0_9HYME
MTDFRRGLAVALMQQTLRYEEAIEEKLVPVHLKFVIETRYIFFGTMMPNVSLHLIQPPQEPNNINPLSFRDCFGLVAKTGRLKFLLLSSI